MIATLGWDGNFQTATVQDLMWFVQMRHTTFGAIGGISIPTKKADRVRTKVMVDHKILSEGNDRILHIARLLLLKLT